ncbi:sulfatase [Natrinema saccharevitans]|uniref:Sulfatase n=1 Tax=Natrinema saccharevitans TaxID=301967 RepID=A0A1S8AV37_9EURY|nr:sulfatase [Natrinema saccharevitans]OLZ40768.1 sulfatase [Natrinema saccharevitans]
MNRNVAVIVMDTMRASSVDSVSLGSGSFASLDENHDKIVNINNAFTSAPWTLPSHASLFTGTTPSKHGAHAGHKQLNDTHTTLAEVLANEGYETVAVSNNTWVSEEFGFNQGFETFYKTWQYVQSDTDLGKISQTYDGFNMLWEATKTVFKGNPVTNVTNAIYGQFFRRANDDGATRTNKWIKNWLTSRDDSRPFFLFVNYLEPHLEYRPPKAHAEEHLPEGVTYEEAMEVSQDAWGYIAGRVELSREDFEVLRALYRAEIAYLEEKIEEVIDLLKAVNEWEETLFILTSDHGENIGDHNLMDHQYALYDTLLHVPLYVRDSSFEDCEIDDIVQLIDIPPTILDILDIDASDAREQFQGISFYPDADETRKYAVAEYMAPQPSMDALETKIGDLSEHVYDYDRSLRSIRTDQYKYIRGSDGSQELYDIQRDPQERNDLTASKEDIVGQFDATLDEWLNSFEQTEDTDSVSMDEDTKSRLEDLGYLQ